MTKKIEWRLRAVTRYQLTRFETESDDPRAQTCVSPCGEFDSIELGSEIGEGMALKDRALFPDASVTFDAVAVPGPKVRAKFACTEIRKFRDSTWSDDRDGGSIRLSAVYKHGGPEGSNAAVENHIFGKATPSGYAEMAIVNPEAFARFERGREYYIDFIPCPIEGEATLLD
jgi:hypothetical protein